MDAEKIMGWLLKATAYLLLFAILLGLIYIILPVFLPPGSQDTIFNAYAPIIIMLSIVLSAFVFSLFSLVVMYHAFKHSKPLWAVAVFFITPISLLYYYLYVMNKTQPQQSQPENG